MYISKEAYYCDLLYNEFCDEPLSLPNCVTFPPLHSVLTPRARSPSPPSISLPFLRLERRGPGREATFGNYTFLSGIIDPSRHYWLSFTEAIWNEVWPRVGTRARAVFTDRITRTLTIVYTHTHTYTCSLRHTRRHEQLFSMHIHEDNQCIYTSSYILHTHIKHLPSITGNTYVSLTLQRELWAHTLHYEGRNH